MHYFNLKWEHIIVHVVAKKPPFNISGVMWVSKAMRLTETEPIFRSSSTLKNQTEPNRSYILKDKNKSNRTEPIQIKPTN